MLRVGLTGGIGSGKSEVTRRLGRHGAHVVDADLLAREVVEPGTPGLVAVVDAFGPDVLRPDGHLDRERLGALVFGPGEQAGAARQRLNAIVHPLIGQRTAALLRDVPAGGVLVHDVPLLVENGLAPAYHLVVVVETPADVRVERLVQRRGVSGEAARARIAAQADDATRRRVADVVIANRGDLADLDRAAERLWAGRIAPYAANLAAGRRAPRGPVALVAPDPDWARQADRLRARLRLLGGERVVAVDHIGSTAVPGLVAKDVLDLQVQAPSWEEVEALGPVLGEGGFPRREDVADDPPRAGVDPDPAQWRKRFHANADPGRPVNVHVRIAGSAAARAALALRDLLRGDEAARREYAEVKQQLASACPDDVDAYAEGKTEWLEVTLPRALGRWSP